MSETLEAPAGTLCDFRSQGSATVTGTEIDFGDRVERHLRDASGKLVLEESGELLFGPAGESVKVTPHVDADFASVACPALGGSPA